MHNYHIPLIYQGDSKDEIIQKLLTKIEELDNELDKFYAFVETLPVDIEDILQEDH